MTTPIRSHMRTHMPGQMRTLFLNALLPALIALPAFAQSRLVVVNKGDAGLGIIDTVAGRQIAAVPAGGFTPHEVAVSPDGRIAYAPIYGSGGVATAGTDGDKLAVVDIASAKVIHTIDFGHGVRPHFPVYDASHKLLYVTTEIDQTVTVIDPATYKILGTIPTGQKQSHLLTISHDGKRGYTANVGPGTVSVLDLEARKLLTIIPVSGNTQRISISNDDKLVFTSDQTKPQLAVIDTATNKVKSWVPLPAIGYGSAPTPDGHWLLVAMPSVNQVAVVDLTTLTMARTVDVGKSPQAVVVRPDGKQAFASCILSQQVAVIDLTTWTVPTMIAAGKGVDGLAWAK